MKILVRSAITIAAMVLVWSCKHEIKYPPVTPIAPVTNKNGNPTIDTTVCFQRDVLPIFISHCAMRGCHNAGNGEQDYILDNYQDITSRGIIPGNSGASRLYTIIQSGEMPRYPAPQVTGTELYYIKRWIDMGAPNDTNCSSGGCDTTIFTYTLAVQPMIQTYCIGCHSTTSAANSGGGFVLDTYTGVQTLALNGKLLGSIQHAAGHPVMPLGGSKIPDCEITQVSKWIAAGAQNN